MSGSVHPLSVKYSIFALDFRERYVLVLCFRNNVGNQELFCFPSAAERLHVADFTPVPCPLCGAVAARPESKRGEGNLSINDESQFTVPCAICNKPVVIGARSSKANKAGKSVHEDCHALKKANCELGPEEDGQH
jgi:endogenous inhibitor of DNA gyrase (YacG/DUF329 family)